MEVTSSAAATAATVAAPRGQEAGSTEVKAPDLAAAVVGAPLGSETAQELADSMKSLHGFSRDLQRLRTIMEKHRKGR